MMEQTPLVAYTATVNGELAELLGALVPTEDNKASFQILRQLTPSRLSHLLRTVPPSITSPLPPKPGFRVELWEGLLGGCRVGLNLERCRQLAAFVIQPVG